MPFVSQSFSLWSSPMPPAHPIALLGALLLLLNSCGRFQDLPDHPAPVDSTQFAELLSRTAKAPWTEGNAIRTLVNGDEFFPAMLHAIRNARSSVTFETFVFKQGAVGRDFTVALSNAASRGVRVHVILDSNGSQWVDEVDVGLLRSQGVELHFFRPFSILRPLAYNTRTHRKTLVIDGKIAFTGGAGFTDRWLGNAQSPRNWRDTQYEVRGPVVRQFQHSFNDNWNELTGETLSGPAYFPELPSVGSLTVHLSVGAPDERGDTIGSSYLLAIRAARKAIRIAHSYFIPHRILVDALLAARKRGVSVEIIICGDHTDFPLGQIAQRPALRKLAEAGAEILEYEPTMMHAKLVMVDDHFVSVGSANFDDRSFFINDEANLHVLDDSFALQHSRIFDEDKKHCRRLESEDLEIPFKKIPAHIGAQLLKSQL